MSNYVHNRWPHAPADNRRNPPLSKLRVYIQIHIYKYIYTNTYIQIRHYKKKRSPEDVLWVRWTKQATIQSFIIVQRTACKLYIHRPASKKKEKTITRRCSLGLVDRAPTQSFNHTSIPTPPTHPATRQRSPEDVLWVWWTKPLTNVIYHSCSERRPTHLTKQPTQQH